MSDSGGKFNTNINACGEHQQLEITVDGQRIDLSVWRTGAGSARVEPGADEPGARPAPSTMPSWCGCQSRLASCVTAAFCRPNVLFEDPRKPLLAMNRRGSAAAAVGQPRRYRRPYARPAPPTRPPATPVYLRRFRRTGTMPARERFSRPWPIAPTGVGDGDDMKLLMRFMTRTSGGRVRAGIQQALTRSSSARSYLFRDAGSGAAAIDGLRISDSDLASRLSFFCWSSIPDEELLQVAERGHCTRTSRAPGQADVKMIVRQRS